MNLAGAVARVEHAVKGPIWGCQMCGQCVLHDTGLTCPMNCPKTLLNGPCGGVRADGTCREFAGGELSLKVRHRLDPSPRASGGRAR